MCCLPGTESFPLVGVPCGECRVPVPMESFPSCNWFPPPYPDTLTPFTAGHGMTQKEYSLELSPSFLAGLVPTPSMPRHLDSGPCLPRPLLFPLLLSAYTGFPYAMLSCLSHVWLLANLKTVAFQAPLSMGFSRQEYWSGLLCPPPGDLPDPGIEPMSPVSPALAGGFFTAPWVVTSSTFQHYLESPIGFPYFGPKKENRKKKKQNWTCLPHLGPVWFPSVHYLTAPREGPYPRFWSARLLLRALRTVFSDFR